MPSTVIQVEEQYHNYPGGDEFYVQILDKAQSLWPSFAVGDNAMVVQAIIYLTSQHQP